MALVSSIYRLAPSAPSWDRDEAERRLKVTLRRLVGVYGVEGVVNRIRAYPCRAEEEITKAWLVLSAWEESKRGGRAGSW